MSHTVSLFFLSYKRREELQGTGHKELAGSVQTAYWDKFSPQLPPGPDGANSYGSSGPNHGRLISNKE